MPFLVDVFPVYQSLKLISFTSPKGGGVLSNKIRGEAAEEEHI
jgi:hypothetical protein